jgi:hypothetical protein
MKKERPPVYVECPCCQQRFSHPGRFYRLADELEHLAADLAVPEAALIALISRGAIPVCKLLDRDGQPCGLPLVLFDDAQAVFSEIERACNDGQSEQSSQGMRRGNPKGAA